MNETNEQHKSQKELNNIIAQCIKTAAVKISKPNGSYVEIPQFTQAKNRVLYWREHLQFQEGKKITLNSLAKFRALGYIELQISTPIQESRRQLSLAYKELQVAKYSKKTNQNQ